MSRNRCTGAAVLFLLAEAAGAMAACQTVGVFVHDARAEDGFTVFAPMNSMTTYLIDNEGRQVHTWPSAYRPGDAAHLLPGGTLLRTAKLGNTVFGAAGGAGGRVEEIAWDGTLLWGFDYSTALVSQHHDAIRLPSGNVLMVAWEYKTMAEAIAAGRNPALLVNGSLWPEHIIEVQDGGGAIVWEWHAWDHLVQDFDSAKANYDFVADHPERIDLNFTAAGGADWLHANSVAYHPDLDEILISIHNLNEIWVIDHATTKAEAAGRSGGRRGKGGDLLYRWGNPRAYRAGTATDQKLFGQHDAHWIGAGLAGAGRILVFNNGAGRAGAYSTVEEIDTPVDALGGYPLPARTKALPAASILVYQAPVPSTFFAQNISGAQRLANGDTLICDGPHGTFFEVTAAGETVWRYVSPVVQAGPLTQGDPVPGQMNLVFRAYRFAATDPELLGQTLVPGATVERPRASLVADVGNGHKGVKTAAGRRFTWPDLTLASGYTLFRSERPDPSNWLGEAGVGRASSGGVGIEDTAGAADLEHYRVVPLDDCGIWGNP